MYPRAFQLFIIVILILAGDNITLETEKFKVISRTNGNVVAMLYYNSKSIWNIYIYFLNII